MTKLINRNEITDFIIDDNEILVFRGLEPNPEVIDKDEFERWIEGTRLVPLVRKWDNDIVLMDMEDFYLRPSLVKTAIKQFKSHKTLLV